MGLAAVCGVRKGRSATSSGYESRVPSVGGAALARGAATGTAGGRCMGARSRSCPDQQSKLVVYPPFRFLKPCHRGRTAGLELDCCACKSAGASRAHVHAPPGHGRSRPAASRGSSPRSSARRPAVPRTPERTRARRGRVPALDARAPRMSSLRYTGGRERTPPVELALHPVPPPPADDRQRYLHFKGAFRSEPATKLSKCPPYRCRPAKVQGGGIPIRLAISAASSSGMLRTSSPACSSHASVRPAFQRTPCPTSSPAS